MGLFGNYFKKLKKSMKSIRVKLAIEMKKAQKSN